MDNNNLIRVMPFSMEAEQACLGAMLLEKQAINIAVNKLCRDDFYREAHQIIWDNIISLYNKNKPVEIVIFAQLLRDNNILEKVGGEMYIAEIMNKSSTASAVKYYSEIVKEKSEKRKMIKFADELMNKSFEPDGSFTEILQYAEKSIFNQFMNNIKNENSVTDYTAAKKVYNDIDEVLTHGKRINNISTGVSYLDVMTGGGFRGGQMIVIGGTTSAGKTALALQVSDHMAFNHSMVEYYCYEMKPHELMQRLVSAKTMIPLQRIANAELSTDEMVLMSEVVASFQGKLSIDSSCPKSIDVIKSRCRKIKMEKGLSCVVIDYLQQISGERPKDDRARVSQVSRDIKLMALELDVPVIVLSQLSREHLKRDIKRPVMYDLKESGSIEMDADMVIMMYRPGFWGEQELLKSGYNPNHPGITEINIEKYRQGKKASFHLDFDGEHCVFNPYILK